jgi:stage II sporulation protein D
MRGRSAAALGWLPVLTAALGLPPPAAAEEVIRIAVARGATEVRLSGGGLMAASLADDTRPLDLAGDRAVVRLEGDELKLDGNTVEGPGVVFAALRTVHLGQRELAGEVQVRRAERGLAVVDVLPLEEYVALVTSAEMPASFPAEALKAQAVAARTFALARKLEARAEGRDYDLGATVLDQVYPGQGGNARAAAAAQATAGEVLVFDHRPIEAYFHSTCGGRTERGADALGRDLPYLASVPCNQCRAAPRFRWSAQVSAAEMARICGLSGQATSVRIVERSSSGRAARVEVWAGTRRVRMTAVDLRQRLGYERLYSLAFEVRAGRDGFLFEGKGSGHGAGLCQWGAAGRARAGEDYRRILASYYRGTELVKIY